MPVTAVSCVSPSDGPCGMPHQRPDQRIDVRKRGARAHNAAPGEAVDACHPPALPVERPEGQEKDNESSISESTSRMPRTRGGSCRQEAATNRQRSSLLSRASRKLAGALLLCLGIGL